jgi:tetratricopeptide (TPR) repeat protein
MAAQAKKWIVRDDIGHIYGPFEVTKLKDLLAKGILTGDEQTAQYPAGDWRPMSTEPELYNLILDTLSAQQKRPAVMPGEPPPKRPELSKKSEASHETPQVTIPFPKERIKTKPNIDVKIKEKVKRPTPEPRRFAPAPLQEDSLFEKIKESHNLVPILLIFGALLLFSIGTIYRTGNGKRTAINLLVPHPKAQGNPAQAEDLIKAGVTAFSKDTYSNYVKAEEAFVGAVNESPVNSDALLMLILTDLELWPFTKQDSSDQGTVQSLMQAISRADKLGTKRAVAAPAVEMILGNDSTARTEIDSALVKEPNEAFLYAMKGQTYFDTGDYVQATSYFEKAAALNPNWVKSYYQTGLSYSKQGLGPQAQQALFQALRMNPSHPSARMELGVVETRYLNDDQKAQEYLSVALSSEEKMPPFVEARGRIAWASLLSRMGDNVGAKKQAMLASQLSPNDPDVVELLAKWGEKSSESGGGLDHEHMALGDQYMRTENYLGAQAQYKAAFTSNPKNARAAMKVAEALWKLHQAGEAMEFLQKSIGSDSKFIESYILLADYKSQRYDFEGAARALDAALKKNQKNYEIFRGYGQLELRRGNLPAAETNLIHALQLYEVDLLSNELMSKVQFGKKDLVKAIEYGKKAIDIDRGDPAAQVEYARALGAYEGVKGATAYLRDLISLYPAQTQLRIGLADILIQDEQYAIAEQILRQVVAAEESNKEAFLLLGDAQYAQNNFNGAINSYFTSGRIDPSDPTGLSRAGELYLKMNKTAKAIEEFNLVLRVNEVFPRTHYNLARAYLAEGITEKALEELAQEKKLNPRLADPYEFAGDILLSTRHFQQAVREYQMASEYRPLGAGLYVKLAKSYRGQGLYDEAMAMLRLAAAKESGYSEIYKEYGYIYDAKGMAPEAVSNFERYLTLEPNSSERETIAAKIKELK